jgi:glycosyltransferase involved in cell wall biosynthesis
MVIDRDGADPDRVTVVRTGPDPRRLKRVDVDPNLRRGRKHLVAYIGVMGPQDGVDIVLRAADIVVNQLDRDDIAFTLIGSGDCFDDLVALRSELGLSDVVHFTGRVPDEDVAAILSTADVGISPDPKNSLNDVSTMNKTMEYMAFGVPVVAFDLRETRVSAGDGAVYATPNDVAELAGLIVELVDDEVKRVSMGIAGRTRVEDELAWNHQAPRYVRVYDDLLSRSSNQAAEAART